MTGNFWRPSQAKFISPVWQFCEKDKSFMVIQSKNCKTSVFFPSHMFTFHQLVQLLLPTVKLNGVSPPISIESKIVNGLNQAKSGCVYNLKFRKLSNLGIPVFSYVLEHVPDDTLRYSRIPHLRKWILRK